MPSIETINEVVDAVIKAEGGATVTNDPSDSGGRTQYGIAETSNPEAWKDGKVTLDEARGIYHKKYVAPFEGVEDTGLFHQLVDFGVTSGPETAAKVLQQILGVAVDGDIGPGTLKAIENYPPGKVFGVPVPGFVRLNLALRDARTIFYIGITKKWPKNLRFLLGWVNRVQEFR